MKNKDCFNKIQILESFTKDIIQALEEQCQIDEVEGLDLSTICDVICETLREKRSQSTDQ